MEGRTFRVVVAEVINDNASKNGLLFQLNFWHFNSPVILGRSDEADFNVVRPVC